MQTIQNAIDGRKVGVRVAALRARLQPRDRGTDRRATAFDRELTRGVAVVDFARGIPHLLKGEYSRSVGPEIDSRLADGQAVASTKLERLYDRIVGCKVVVEAPHRHQHKGKLYNVRIDISVPGKDVFVGRSGPQNHAHEDVYVALRDAFDAAGRLLEDHARRLRGDVKTHSAPGHGKVVRLFADYGFAVTPNGQEVYFHKNSVVDDAFDKLDVGNEVRLVIAENEGVEGAQASTVTLIGKHHIVEG